MQPISFEHALTIDGQWLLFHGDRLLVHAEDGAIPTTQSGIRLVPVLSSSPLFQMKSSLGEERYVVAALPPSDTEPAGFRSISLRSVLLSAGESMFPTVGRAWQYLYFFKTHRYCGQCGTPTLADPVEVAVECPACHHRCYPRVSPSIIVAVHRPGEILLAKGVRHRESNMYSVLAGFVESGESMEQTLHREVYEEVGVTVGNLRYFDSQPWPFPHSLMLGFLAEYVSGHIAIDDNEIIDAQWFSLDALPLTPPNFSIAGRLIEQVKALYK